MSSLTENSVKRTLVAMAVPMLAGTFAMNAYNLTDAWFVSKLGLLPQTAIGFIFPVLMLFNCLSMGLGSGITSFVSHTIGQGFQHKAARATTQSVWFMLIVAIVTSTLGFLWIDPVFQKLGADERTLPLIHDFMHIWYLGAPFMYLTAMGNGILIAAGDSKAAGRFMMFGTLLNLVLNPFFIFGYAGFPAMGIRGSATATVIAQLVTAIWMFRCLDKKHNLLAKGQRVLLGWASSIREMLVLGIPNVVSMLLMPISSAVITHLLSGYGPEPVAASGVAFRIEMFAFIIPMALGMTMMPFISLNYGAGRLDRVQEALTLSTRFALMYGAFITAVFFVSAPFLASLFSQNPIVISTLVAYVRIIAFGYGMMETHRYCGFVLVGLHMPNAAMILNFIRVLVLLIPLSILGSHYFGIKGMFVGRLIADLTAGSLGLLWAYHACRKLRRMEKLPKGKVEPMTFVE
jgi:putative MATE family efflux protein